MVVRRTASIIYSGSTTTDTAMTCIMVTGTVQHATSKTVTNILATVQLINRSSGLPSLLI